MGAACNCNYQSKDEEQEYIMPGHEPAAQAPVDKPSETSQNVTRLQDTSVWHGEGVITPITQNQSLLLLNNYNEASDLGEDDEEEENKEINIGSLIDIDCKYNGDEKKIDQESEVTVKEIENLMAIQVLPEQTWQTATTSGLPMDLFASTGSKEQQDINLGLIRRDSSLALK